MRVCVVGAGYVGLVTGACLAEDGHDVILVDLDQTKVDAITAGRAPIHEPGLPELLTRVAGRQLRVTTDLTAAVAASDITLIAVGTPLRNGAIDLGAV
jgi:UDPglucose 6-dehydrogenase